jgi:hypothetical protein
MIILENKKFLILGHPRSGTGFMAKLFGHFGFEIGHEQMRKDGISSWMFTVEDYQVFPDTGLNRKDFSFDYVIMNIRHPLHIVSSTYYTENKFIKSVDFRKKHLSLEGLNDVEMAVNSVLEWYRRIEMQRPNLIICVDRDPEEKLYYFLKRFEHERSVTPVEKIPGKVNARSHPDLCFSYIEKHCRKEIVSNFVEFCLLYGYKLS